LSSLAGRRDAAPPQHGSLRRRSGKVDYVTHNMVDFSGIVLIYPPYSGPRSEVPMRLTRQTNYAIRILMYCAANHGRLSRVPEIAAAYTVSELFLFKILQPLVEHGMVETVRGRNGGVRLGRAATDITLLEVVRVTEDNFTMAECFESDAAECPLIDSCALNEALRKALGAFFEVLASYSIDDLVNARPSMRSLLGIE